MRTQSVKISSPPSDVPIKVKWVNQNPQLSPVLFVDQSTGWAAGESTLLSTSDGGATWTAQDLGFTYPMLIQFIDKNMGWIPTNYGTTVLMTRDGGKTWGSIPTPHGVTFYAAQFVDEKTGWGANNDAIYKTIDGKTWQEIGSGVVKRPFFFVDASNGWAATSTGDIAFSADGGNTWTIQKTNQKFPPLAFFFLDRNRGWAARYQSVLATTDGGNHWYAVNTSVQSVFDCLQFNDANVGWGCGEKTLVHTADGGRTWETRSGATYPNTPPCIAISFIDANTGWCTTDAGTIFKTVDGGKTWQTQNAVPPFSPGKAIRAKDYAGKPKIPQVEFGDGYEFKKILFANKNTGWAIGTLSGGAEGDPQGLIGYTQDGGKTWTTQLTIDEPSDMYFSAKGTGAISTKGYFDPTVGLFLSHSSGRGPWLTEFEFTDGPTITVAWSVELRGNPQVAVKHVEFSPGTDSNFGPLPLKGLKNDANGRSSLKFKPAALGIRPGTKVRFRVHLQDPDGTAYLHEIAKVFVHR